MSDATLPAPRSSSAATVVGDGNRSNSRGIEVELDSNTPLVQSVNQNTNEDATSGSEWRAPGKQKRKRTKYACVYAGSIDLTAPFEAPKSSVALELLCCSDTHC
jgi:hypothetical protein